MLLGKGGGLIQIQHYKKKDKFLKMKKLFLILFFLILLTKFIKAQNGFDSTDIIVVGLIEFENPIFVSVTNAPYLVCDSINLRKINFYYPEIACFDTLAFLIGKIYYIRDNYNLFVNQLTKKGLIDRINLNHKKYLTNLSIPDSNFIFKQKDLEYKCYYLEHTKFLHFKIKYKVYLKYVIDSSLSNLETVLPPSFQERYLNMILPIYE